MWITRDLDCPGDRHNDSITSMERMHDDSYSEQEHMAFVVDGLWLGDIVAAYDTALLDAHGVTHGK